MTFERLTETETRLFVYNGAANRHERLTMDTPVIAAIRSALTLEIFRMSIAERVGKN